ncbi:hypothetical protein CV693_05610 [Borreliella burgdorferi]|nr:hypothetical protein CV679_04950 [Borreliella burgdorferi]PRR32152.1 hypothetical protein CV693_05610 [Borreliella burgdorferi]PRR35577.1 hypothetical protein CV687_05425 [Borreliella burgdorferi]
MFRIILTNYCFDIYRDVFYTITRNGLTWGEYTYYEYLTTSTRIGIKDYLSKIHKVVIASFNY